MPSWVLHVHMPTTVISAAQGSLPLSPWAVRGFAISVGTSALLSATSRRHSLMLPITLARGGAFAFVSSWSSFSMPGAGLDELLLRASRFDHASPAPNSFPSLQDQTRSLPASTLWTKALGNK